MNLQNFLPYKLSVLSNKISAGIALFYKEQYGISIPEWRVLALLSNNPNQSAKDLSTQSQMDKVRISRTVKKLLNKKLIIEYINVKDARSRIYQLSDDGDALIQSVTPKALAFEKKLLEEFSNDDITFLNQCIKGLNQQADKITKSKN